MPHTVHRNQKVWPLVPLYHLDRTLSMAARRSGCIRSTSRAITRHACNWSSALCPWQYWSPLWQAVGGSLPMGLGSSHGDAFTCAAHGAQTQQCTEGRI